MNPNTLLVLLARPSLHLFALRHSRKHRDLLDVDEAISVADQGLMAAFRRYDPAKGPFFPFARLWVERELQRAMKRELAWRKRLVMDDPWDLEPVDEQADSEAVALRGELRRMLGSEDFGMWTRHVEEGESLRELATSYGMSLRRVREQLGRARERVTRGTVGAADRFAPARTIQGRRRGV